jgi:hypothetical protein
MTTADRKATEPLLTISTLFGSVVLVGAAAVVASLIFGGSMGGFGHASVCVNQPDISYGSSAAHLGVTARPGAVLSVSGTLQACARHPDFAQRVLSTLTSAPSVLVWAAVALLLWRLAWCAREYGPFTAATATRLRVLGWVVLIGAVAAAAAQGAATDALLATMVRQNDIGFLDAASNPEHALPVPLLAWAGLLTFARLIRRSAEMDDELQGTV